MLGGPASPNLLLSQGQGPSSALSLIPGLSPALDSLTEKQTTFAQHHFIQDAPSTSVPQ